MSVQAVAAACNHAPIPDTVHVEGQHDAIEVTMATSLDPRTWPRIALCKFCGRGIRLQGLLFNWVLTTEEAKPLV
jgi:hypothetical protein